MNNQQNNPNKQRLSSAIESNQQMIAVFEAEAFEKEWAEGNMARTAQMRQTTSPHKFRDNAKTGTGYAIDALSVAKFSKMAIDMGFSGQVILKIYGNKPFVIFKSTGNLHHFVTQLKQRLGKSKHITIKPKVITMAIGNAHVLKNAVRGGMITFAIFTAINVMDYIIRDQATFARLAGTIASDFAKISVGVLAGVVGHAVTTGLFLPAIGATSAMALTLGPIAVAIVIGFGVGELLNMIDRKYGLTDKIIKSLDGFFSNGENITHEIKQSLNYIEKNPIQAFSRIFGTPVMPF